MSKTAFSSGSKPPWTGQDQHDPLPMAPTDATQDPTDFAQPVPDGGYAWWYIDGISTDGNSALTVIAFIGSVFSPYYARARRQAQRLSQKVEAEQHVAINAVVYTPGGGKRWAMTERNSASLKRDTTSLNIGTSGLRWDNNQLKITINERCAPFGQRLQGTITIDRGAPTTQGFSLHTNNQHWWQPIAPKSEVRVQFDQPGMLWSGDAYVDHNHGSRMLEQDFDYWGWSRSHQLGTAIDYETWQRDGTHRLASVEFDDQGHVASKLAGPRRLLRNSRWGIPRSTRIVASELTQTLEDTPFYARSVMLHQGANKPTTVCEHLDLTRFASPWVQCLLPFRMPRNTRMMRPSGAA